MENEGTRSYLRNLKQVFMFVRCGIRDTADVLTGVTLQIFSGSMFTLFVLFQFFGFSDWPLNKKCLLYNSIQKSAYLSIPFIGSMEKCLSCKFYL